jgi:hypothetical protein
MTFPKKRNKYGNTKVNYDGHTFDSKKEMQRYIVLCAAQEQGVISNLELQPKFTLIPEVVETYYKQLKTKLKLCEHVVQRAITYNGDFAYTKDGERVVEDVKASPKTAALDKAFLLKEKLFRYRMGFSIKRVYNPNDLI